MNWRDHLPIHPVCAAFPELSRDELIALGRDIKTNGLRMPVVIHAGGDAGNPEFKLIDGRSRLNSMVAVGIEFKILRVHCEHDRTSLCLSISGIPIPIDVPGGYVRMAVGLSEAEIKDLAISLNARRRHLTAEQKRNLIGKLLKLDPAKSDRQIAKETGRDHKTVAEVRRKAERRGEIPHVTKRADTKGRKQPAGKPKKTAEDHSAATDMVVTRGDDGVDVWSVSQSEVSVEQRRAEMAALAAATEEAADKPEHKAPSVNGSKAAADQIKDHPKETAERITIKEINAFHREAVGFLQDFTQRLRAWCAARPPIDKDGKAALMQALYLCADGFARLAQELDGRPDLVIQDDLSIPASLQRVPT